MKLCKPSFEIWNQPAGLEGIYKQIEHVGKVCYKSEDKITEDSAKPFVNRMIKLGHGAVLEHGTVYLKVTCKDTSFVTLSVFYGHNKYSKITHSDDNKTYYITTNYRVLVESNHLGDLKYLCEPTEYHEKRICVKFICDRAIANEFVRHRVFSFMQESTRYCNYSKDKFNNELTFIKPCWFDNLIRYHWLTNLQEAEDTYMDLIHYGWKPEQIRGILPLSLKTELVMTGFVSDWKHFFKLRCDSAAHPQARELAIPLKEEFIKKGYITE